MAKKSKGLGKVLQGAIIECLGACLIVLGFGFFMEETYSTRMNAGVGNGGGGGFNHRTYLNWTALGMGGLMLILSTFGRRLSGGFFNPGITLGQMLFGKTRWVAGAIYIAAQLVGSFVGALALFTFDNKANDSLLSNEDLHPLSHPIFIDPKKFKPYDPVRRNLETYDVNPFQISGDNPQYEYEGLIFLTVVGSAILGLATYYARKIATSDLAYGSIVGLSNFVALFFFGGAALFGSFNFVRFIGPAYLDADIGVFNPDSIEWLWWICPAAGAVGGSLLGMILFAGLDDEVKNEEKQKKEMYKEAQRKSIEN